MNIEKQIEIFKFTAEQEKTKKQILAIFARLCSGAKIKGSLFSPSTTLNATKDPHTDIPSENIPLKVTNDDHERITQKLLEFGFIEKQYIFWVDGDNNLDYSCDEDEAALLVEELEKSKKARKLYYDKGEFELYEKHRGDIYDPESGKEGFDPLEHLGHHYYWTDKLILDPNFINPINADFDIAKSELISDELNKKIKARAREIALKRLGF